MCVCAETAGPVFMEPGGGAELRPRKNTMHSESDTFHMHARFSAFIYLHWPRQNYVLECPFSFAHVTAVGRRSHSE